MSAVLTVMVAQLTIARERRGWSQRHLCSHMDTPFNQGRLSAWEAGAQVPTVDSLVAWADSLGYDVALIERGP